MKSIASIKERANTAIRGALGKLGLTEDTTAIPLNKIAEVVAPIMPRESMDDKGAIARGWERMGNAMIDVTPDDERNDDYCTFLLAENIHEVADRVRKAGKDAKAVAVPTETIKGIQLRLPVFRNAYRSPFAAGGALPPVEMYELSPIEQTHMILAMCTPRFNKALDDYWPYDKSPTDKLTADY